MLTGNQGHFLNLIKMETVIVGGCGANSDFLLSVKRNIIRIKAGTELSSSAKRMDADVNEDTFSG